MYIKCIRRQVKARQKEENRDKVEYVKCLGPNLHVQTMGLFSDASSDFIITVRRLIHEAVCSSVKGFLEAVIDGVDYLKLHVVIASGSLVKVN